MRGRKDAKNVDVELYLDDYEKLMFKIEYIDASQNDSENPLEGVRKNKGRLEDATNLQGEEADYNIFKEYGIKFAVYALLVLSEAEAQKEIEAIKKQIDANVRDNQKHVTLEKLFDRHDVKAYLLNSKDAETRYAIIDDVVTNGVRREETKTALIP